jgi:hypothetical protein
MTTDEMEDALHDTAHKIGELCERFDAIEEGMEYQTKLLESILEAIPTRGPRPDMMAAMQPILDSPLIKSNPALAAMVANFTNSMTEGKE